MAVVVTERADTRIYKGGESPSWELNFNIEGTDDSTEARIELLLQTTVVFDGLFRQTPQCEKVGPKFYTGTITYGLKKFEPDENGFVELEFEFGGKTEKRYQSIETRRYPTDAPDYEGAIGVVKNGDQIDVQGVDVYVPTFAFSLKCRFRASYFTANRRNMILLAGAAPVNNAAFLGFNAGELLFKGSSGGLKEGADYGDITFKFEGSPNLTDLTVGEITGIRKDGWEYAEVIREVKEKTDGGTKNLIPKVTGVYVHKVYSASNLSAALLEPEIP